MSSDNRRMFIRPTEDDFASDEAIEAFAQRMWLAFTTQEEIHDTTTD